MEPNKSSDNRSPSTGSATAGAGQGASFVISVRQSGSMIASTLIGIGVLTLPRVTTEFSGNAGWLSAIGGAMLAMLAMFAITKLAKRHPGETIVEYVPALLGPKRWPIIGLMIGFPIFIIFVVYWGISTTLVARMFGEVVIATVLTKTPLEIIILLMLGTAFVLVMYDEEVLARVNEILLPIIIVPILLIALSSLQSARLDNLLPLFQVSWGSLLKGIAITSFSYLGFEIMTIFFARTEQTGKLMAGSLIGIAIPGIVYTLIALSGIAVFGVEELKLLAWPTLELVKTTAVPGLILERLESAFLGVWVAAVFTTVGNLYYATSIMLQRMFKLRGHRWIAFALLPVFYWLSLLPPNVQKLFEYSRWLNYLGGLLALIIPLILLLLSLARKRNGKRSSSGKGVNER